MKIISVLGGKGGSTKTTTCHLLCLGAHLSNIPAAYVLTDPMRKVRSEGRPYSVLDGRMPEQLSVIFGSAQQGLNGYLVIDGGGNRPEFDKEVARNSHMTIIPFRASEEDIDAAAASLSAISNALAWPCAWPTNPFATNAAAFLVEGLSKAFPLRVMTPVIPFVNSASDLLSSELVAPSSAVRTAARKAFNTMSDYYETVSAKGDDKKKSAG